jgi:phosphoglycerate dehydrogenase-like enzyme
MNRVKCLLCTPDDGVMVDVIAAVLSAEGLVPEIVVVADKDDTATIRRELADTDIVYPNKARIDAASIAAAPRLRLIHCGTGYDTVDCAAAAARGITVCNTGAVMARSTAEHTLYLILALAKNGAAAAQEMRAGLWLRHMGHELHGKTLGLLGYGNIARLVATLARAFGMHVVACRRKRGAGSADDVPLLEFPELLDTADILSIHMPLIDSGPDRTRGLLGEVELARFGQRGLGWLINTARGAIIDEAALVAALRAGVVRKAALDVFANEPLPATHPLRALDNVVLTPHVAAETGEALRDRYTLIARNAARVLRGEEPTCRVTDA